MTATMLDDLDKGVRTLLTTSVPPALDQLQGLVDTDIQFATPGAQYTPVNSNLALNLFLYEVKENLQLRDPEPTVRRVGNTYVQGLPSLRVDCCYLVTAWSTGTQETDRLLEHRLLGQALLWLSRFRTLPSSVLAEQENPPPTLVAQTDGHRNMSEFWYALGIPPRPAFHLIVTVEMNLLTDVSGPLVTTAMTRFGVSDRPGDADELVIIGGTVLRGLPPHAIVGAATIVGIDAAHRQVTVDDAGPFQVNDLVTAAFGEQASIANIQGQVITLTMALPSATVGMPLRLAGFEPARVQLLKGAVVRGEMQVDTAGRFTFGPIGRGSYTLTAVARGVGVKTQQVDVPSLSGDYDIQFP